MEPQKENRLPNIEVSPQKSSESGFNFPENAPGRSIELEKNKHEAEGIFENASSVGELAQSMLPPVNTTTVQDDASTNDSSDSGTLGTPSVASAADLMEKEWVDKLKNMINETRNDPYSRQQKFKEIQMDYLKKRYNRIINEGK